MGKGLIRPADAASEAVASARQRLAALRGLLRGLFNPFV
jgi:hypothetical protein